MSKAVKAVNGITSKTYERMVLDAGRLYAEYDLPGQRAIGATRGGSTFVVESEFREMTVDGAPGPVKGSQRLLRSSAKLSTNIVEIVKETLLTSLPGSINTPTATHDVITRERQIEAGDYLDNLTLVAEKAGTDELVIIKIDNALALNGLEFSAAEDDETVIAQEFTAHYDPANLAKEPWSISYPKETVVTSHTVTYIAGANGTVFGDLVQTVVDGADSDPVGAIADDTYEFIDWDDASTDNPRTDVNVTTPITVTANFALI